MANYIGKKCISCGELFNQGDDIVVCPECGTPYHRECYLKEGSCINTELHDSGMSWGETAQSGDESIRCIRCGFENASDKIFCEQCGTPLIKGQETESRPFNVPDSESENTEGDGEGTFNPFGASAGGRGHGAAGGFGPIPGQMVFDKNSEVDGIKLEDYARYVRTNPLPFLSSFIRFGKFGRKISLNIPAFLFPHIYFFFRKMMLVGTILLVVNAVFNLPVMIDTLQSGRYMNYTIDLGIDTSSKLFKELYTAGFYLSFALQFVAGFLANYIYYKKAKKDITKLRSDETLTEEQVAERLPMIGGTSMGALIFSFVLYTAVLIGGVFLVYQLK